MMYLLYILISLSLLGVLYQDLSYRKIHILLPVLLMGALIGLSYHKGEFFVRSIVEILGFILLNIVGVLIYFSIKNKKLINPLKKYIGLGDILFLIAIIPLFMLQSYMLFFITGMLISLMVYGLFKNKLTYKSIPLAGYLSGYLGILMIINFFTTHNIFRTIYF